MRRLVVAGFVLVLVGFALYSQTPDQKPFVVQYLDGSVQVQLKGQTAWKTLKVKAEVPADATVKLAKGAVVELARGKTLINLIKDGLYPMAGLVSKVPTTGSGLGSTLAQKIAAITGGSQTAVGGVRSGETVGGVRANEGGASPDWPGLIYHWGLLGAYGDEQSSTPRFVEEEELDIDAAARMLITAPGHKPDYESAILKLEKVIDDDLEVVRKYEMAYLLATAYSELGSDARAWKAVTLIPSAVSRDSWVSGDAYCDFLLRKAQIQVNTLQYEDALVTLKPLLEPLTKDVFGQAACLVAYDAYKGLNRHKDASGIRQKGLSITLYRADKANNFVPVETETERILKNLE